MPHREAILQKRQDSIEMFYDLAQMNTPSSTPTSHFSVYWPPSGYFALESSYWQLAALGVDCQVVAPALVPTNAYVSRRDP
jgi:hypothetical protein